jgi:hypothetical protein
MEEQEAENHKFPNRKQAIKTIDSERESKLEIWGQLGLFQQRWSGAFARRTRRLSAKPCLPGNVSEALRYFLAGHCGVRYQNIVNLTI